jgi:aspartate kinase
MAVVLKYGGTSVGSIEKIKNIAKHLIYLKEKYKDVVVVASAMGKTTDELLRKAKEISNNPEIRELDSLVSTGEQQTIALLAIAVNDLGYKAVSMTGFQANITTVGIHTKSRIKSINHKKICEYLKKDYIVFVAGFQGINEKGDITTLGRGGSDISAVAIASTLNCECRIYTDVDGIYPVDPNLVEGIKPLKQISYDEIMEMAHLGAKVMETRAVELGKKYNVPIYVGRSLCEEGGTYIVPIEDILEEKVITGISVTKEIIMTLINNIKYSVDKVAEIFTVIGKNNINVNMIDQEITRDGNLEISFSTVVSEKHLLKKAISEIGSLYPEAKIDHNADHSMISVVGIGMANSSGVAGRLFKCLSRKKINFYEVSTSEISISLTIDRNRIEQAVCAITKEFNL